MPNLFISGHATIDYSFHGKPNSPSLQFQVPTGLDIIFYCPEGRGLSMGAGWALWDMLMYDEHGGEAAAYAARHPDNGSAVWCPNYFIQCYSDAARWLDGPMGSRNHGKSHPAKSAYGVIEVGTMEKLWSFGQADCAYGDEHNGVFLHDVVKECSRLGAKRIYFGCCRTRVDAGGIKGMGEWTPKELQGIGI